MTLQQRATDHAAKPVQPESRHDTAADARRRLIATMPVIERHMELAGMGTAVLEGGSGAPLILLHGPFGYAAHWLRIIPELTKSHRVIAPDLPGHGSSDAIDADLDLERMLAWLGELIQQTCTSPPVVVGQALGGAIAARFACRHRKRIDRLVLTDTFGLTAFEPQPVFGEALHAFLSAPSLQTQSSLWRQCAFDLDKLQQQVGPLWTPFEAYNLERARTPTVMSAAMALIKLFGAAIPPEELMRILAPTTLIWGRHDRAIPLGVAQDASERYDWPLIVIEDAAADSAIEQPEAFLRALRGVLGERS